MTEGTVISYDPDSAEGDIREDQGDDTFPFFKESFKNPADKDRLKVGDRVRFKLVGGMTGVECTDLEIV